VHHLFAPSLLTDPSNWKNYSLIPRWISGRHVPLLYGGAAVLPQAWSLSVELVFYCVAPLIILLLWWRPVLLVTIASIATAFFLWACYTAPDMSSIENVVYPNAVTCIFMFLWARCLSSVARLAGDPNKANRGACNASTSITFSRRDCCSGFASGRSGTCSVTRTTLRSDGHAYF